MAGEFGALALQIDGLITALDRVAQTVDGSSMALQRKMGTTAENLGNSIGENIDRLVKSLDGATEAANRAAFASSKHARNLAWATWALVGATVVLAGLSAFHGA